VQFGSEKTDGPPVSLKSTGFQHPEAAESGFTVSVLCLQTLLPPRVQVSTVAVAADSTPTGSHNPTAHTVTFHLLHSCWGGMTWHEHCRPSSVVVVGHAFYSLTRTSAQPRETIPLEQLVAERIPLLQSDSARRQWQVLLTQWWPPPAHRLVHRRHVLPPG